MLYKSYPSVPPEKIFGEEIYQEIQKIMRMDNPVPYLCGLTVEHPEKEGVLLAHTAVALANEGDFHNAYNVLKRSYQHLKDDFDGLTYLFWCRNSIRLKARPEPKTRNRPVPPENEEIYGEVYKEFTEACEHPEVIKKLSELIKKYPNKKGYLLLQIAFTIAKTKGDRRMVVQIIRQARECFADNYMGLVMACRIDKFIDIICNRYEKKFST